VKIPRFNTKKLEKQLKNYFDNDIPTNEPKHFLLREVRKLIKEANNCLDSYNYLEEKSLDLKDEL